MAINQRDIGPEFSKLLLICPMEFYTADKVFSPSGKLIADGILVMERDVVLDLIDPMVPGVGLPDSSSLKKLKGVLSPGLINAHCHLELSGLKGLVTPGRGLAGFIQELQAIRRRDESILLEAAIAGDQFMFENGIQAVGDICNSVLTVEVKQKSKILYHNFIELFAFRPEQAQDTFNRGTNLLAGFQGKENLSGMMMGCSITPHAPYSTSPALMALMSENAGNAPLSIHMMESKAEFEFLMEGSGAFRAMMDKFAVRVDDLLPYDKNPLQIFLEIFGGKGSLIAVHNTYLELLSEELIRNPLAAEVFYCLCPRANQYIEGVYPPLDFLRGLKRKIVLGTDSLASNFDLNLINEVKQLLSIENVPMEEWLGWITVNGAEALGMEDRLGSFEKGKRPGVIVIAVDFSVERLV